MSSEARWRENYLRQRRLQVAAIGAMGAMVVGALWYLGVGM